MEINRVISRGPVFRENKPSLSKLGTLNYILRDKVSIQESCRSYKPIARVRKRGADRPVALDEHYQIVLDESLAECFG